jgi:hypothetical protein
MHLRTETTMHTTRLSWKHLLISVNMVKQTKQYVVGSIAGEPDVNYVVCSKKSFDRYFLCLNAATSPPWTGAQESYYYY